MRQFALLCAWSLLAASCGSAEIPVASATPTSRPPDVTAAVTTRPSPTVEVFTRGKVEIGDNYYSPQEITIFAGGTVTWQIATGENQHDVVSSDGFFRSNSPMSRGVDMFTFTFTKPGVYTYICSYHVPENMVGRVIVK
jgi:plastocyanin